MGRAVDERACWLVLGTYEGDTLVDTRSLCIISLPLLELCELGLEQGRQLPFSVVGEYNAGEPHAREVLQLRLQAGDACPPFGRGA